MPISSITVTVYISGNAVSKHPETKVAATIRATTIIMLFVVFIHTPHSSISGSSAFNSFVSTMAVAPYLNSTYAFKLQKRSESDE